jgi:tripartite-type tricarboxylate transporter receptor subunit TctC
MAKVKIEHIAYKGTGPAIADLLAGQVQMQFGGLPALMPHIKSGRMRALAISTARRVPSLPDLPTVAESGLPGYDTAGWVGLAAPANTPRTIVSALSEQLTQFKRTPEVRERFAEMGAEPIDSSPEQFRAFIQKEVPQWKKVLRPIE